MELLTVAEMTRADGLAIEMGPFDGYGLMRNAGRQVAQVALAKHGEARRVHMLCGPGNNGGDGYVAAAELARAGVEVRLHALAPPRPGSDAGRARDDWQGPVLAWQEFEAQQGDLVIDAVFGAGLARPVEPDVREAIARARRAGCAVLAVDLPSGVAGDDGRILGDAFRADWTVTFFRKKPGHLLLPGKLLCGEVHLVDIGIADRLLAEIQPLAAENLPERWADAWPRPDARLHKYSRGAVGVFSGGATSTGAARLAAMAAQRAGAGAVTLLSPASALLVNACHLTSIMLARLETVEELAALLEDGRSRAYVLGPGFGVTERAVAFALEIAAREQDGLVLDADAITALSRTPGALADLATLARKGPGRLVLTPHEGEFRRLFPDIASDARLSKVDRARKAADRSAAIVIYKGPDTVIAAPDGRAAINGNASAALATAGSGDVLAGIVAGLLARGMAEFEAACAAVWIHGEAGNVAGPHAIAEDLPGRLPSVLAKLERRLAAQRPAK